MAIEKCYSPEFRVHLGGVQVPDDLRRAMASVSFTTGFEGADRVEVVVANQALRWLDHALLKLETPVRLAMGYIPDGVVPVFAGELTGVAANFPSTGVPQLTLAAQDRRHRMQKGTQAVLHADAGPDRNVARSDQAVGNAIAAKHGVRIDLDPLGAKLAAVVGAAAAVVAAVDPDASQKAARSQMNQSDYDFLRRVARENGLELLIDHSDGSGGKVLRMFSPFDHLTAEVELEYGRSLIEFTPRETNVGQVASVRANVWVPANKSRIGLSLGAGGDPPGFTLTVGPPAATDEPNAVVVLNEPLTPATAPRRLLGELMPRLNAQLTGTGSTIGDPRIRAGAVVRLTGLGERFGGLYRVTSATHTIDGGGYKTRFDVRKEIWLNGIPKAVQKAVRINRPADIKVMV